jgi:hypothetical protein
MTVTVDQMHAHVVELCTMHDLEVQWCARCNSAISIRVAEFVKIPRVRSPISYAVALHEIGHVLGRFQHSRSTIVRERWAWEWAKRNALVWTPRMARCAKESMAWYLARKWPPIPTFAELNPHLSSE